MYSCKKEGEDTIIKEDNIVYTEINKTIKAGQVENLYSLGCGVLLCKIDTTLKEVKIYQSGRDSSCVCDAFFMISESYFLKNDVINASTNWGGKLCLDSLVNKGEIFIGLKDVSYPSGNNKNYYGWMRVILSDDKTELQIIDRAKNLTEGNVIKAGQVK